MTRLCLMRHGQTDWNLEGRYQGQSDVPLNEIGRAQAYAAAEKLQAACFAAIYSSDLQRAKATAEIIGNHLQLPITLDARLREIGQGEWEGQSVDLIKERHNTLWRAHVIDPIHIRPPGGETVCEVATRVYAVLDDIARYELRLPVLVISHGLALATAICWTDGLPIAQAYSRIPDNAEPIWIDWHRAVQESTAEHRQN